MQGIIILSSLGFAGAELTFAGMLHHGGCKAAIMLICSVYGLPNYNDLLKSGVQSIVSTSASLAELEAAICAIAEKQAETLKHQYMNILHAIIHQSLSVFLSDREREITQLLAADSTDKEIADHLGVDVRTINNQLRYIYAKFGVRSRYGAVGAAFSQGILTPYSVAVVKASLQEK